MFSILHKPDYTTPHDVQVWTIFSTIRLVVCAGRLRLSAKVSRHQQEAWRWRDGWKVQPLCMWTNIYLNLHVHTMRQTMRNHWLVVECSVTRDTWVTVSDSQRAHHETCTLTLTNNKVKSNIKSNAICGYTVKFQSSLCSAAMNVKYFKLMCLLCEI